MRHPGGPSAENLPQVQRQRSGNGWDSRGHGQLLEALSQGTDFPGYGFGHCRPALDLPPPPKARTSTADGDAASSGRFSANSCYCADTYERDSPLGSHGSCSPGTLLPIITSNPYSPGRDYASAIAPRYSVKVRSLALRDAPSRSASRIATLNFQDEVGLIETAGAWGRVRDQQRNLVGWASRRYLEPLAADSPPAVPQHWPPEPKEP
jgi:hypothetical protein